MRIINGIADHVHCLFLLSPKKAIAETIKQVKGATSHWVNEQEPVVEKFSWQTGYAAYSVSESQLDKVFNTLKTRSNTTPNAPFSRNMTSLSNCTILKAISIMAQSSIEWTELTWNPTTGCNKVSAGCKHCYAKIMSRRLKAMGVEKYRNNFTLTLHPQELETPYQWRD